MKIQTWRVYESAGGRGLRVLVDRLWPRGLRKEDLHLDLWLKDIAPSDALRKWFGHESVKWEEFKKRYFKELAGKEEVIDQLVAQAGERTVILLYGAKDKEHNQAVALKEYLEKVLVKA
jgi:uncharacterized protein YeaO (DUF488 family)